MFDKEAHKKIFSKHIAKFTDLGDIKILNFAEPNNCCYYVRFLFDESQYKLHISGDLGDLTATNYKNMTYESFGDFVRNPPYFIGKVDCHSRDLFEYDEDTAYKEIEKMIKEYEWELPKDYENTHDFICDILEDFSDRRGLSEKGYDVLSEIDPDAWEYANSIGKRSSGIAELYMLAFELATEQLKQKEKHDE